MEREIDSSIRKTGTSVTASDFRAEHGADSAIDIANVLLNADWCLLLEGIVCEFNQSVIECSI